MLRLTSLYGFLIMLFTFTSSASAQELSPPAMKYVMSLTADLDQPYVIGDRLIFNAPSGTVEMANGEKGEILPPTGEWATMYPDGVIKLDVRMTIKMEDQSLLFYTYSGKMLLNETGLSKWQAGELITPEDARFITNPLVRTDSERYGWMNSTVFIGKMVEVQPANDTNKPLYVRYDVYAVEP